ncbi:MAG: phosphonate metabolism transcriptional regulator PhnF [Polymorphobacter sp.]|uniref:phosphonate metabolism transcriptional regulator PhnF n=1 Tax=Polymorphobacter sp. TaxID=1909290 RepID=UPI003A852F53
MARPARQEPLWRTIAKSLESRILARDLAPGDKLPTEQRLCDQFDTNRYTVRRALSHLQARGLVESTQGRGSFVRKPTMQYRIGRRTRFSDLLQPQAADLETRLLTLEQRPATPDVGAALGVKAGTPAIFIERMGYAHEQPISISTHWFVSARLPGFRKHYTATQSITQTLAACGVPDYTRARTRISSRLPSAAEAELLGLPRHIPLLVTRSWNVDSLERPLEYGEARIASDRIELLIEAESSSSIA